NGLGPLRPHAELLPRGAIFLLSLPLLCAIYLIAGAALPGWAGTLAQLGLAGVVIAWSPTNFEQGLFKARLGSDQGTRFLEDIRAGKRLVYILHRHQWLIPGWHDEGIPNVHYVQMANGMRLLRQAGVPGFAELQDGLPPSNEVIVYELGKRTRFAMAPPFIW